MTGLVWFADLEDLIGRNVVKKLLFSIRPEDLHCFDASQRPKCTGPRELDA
jgi:hypothetical protein